MDNENKLLYTSDRGGHMEPIEIGKYLRKLRLENGFTQKDIAEKMHVTHQAVSSWENGKNIPDIDILTRLSEMYHITIDDIVMQNGKEDVDWSGVISTTG